MEKKVSIYDYQNFILLLNDDYIERSTQNPNYSLRAYARDLEISIGYLSKLLTRKQNISLGQGEKILKILGYDQDEITYGRHLLQYNSAKTEYEKECAFTFLKQFQPFSQLHQDASKDLVLNSLNHFLVYALAKTFPLKNDLEKASNLVGISSDEFTPILNELIEQNYLSLDNNLLCIIDNSFVIKNHKKLHLFHNDFSQFVLKKLLDIGDLASPECCGHGLTLAVDNELLPELYECIKHAIRNLYKIAEKSKKPSPDFLVFFSESTVAIRNQNDPIEYSAQERECRSDQKRA